MLKGEKLKAIEIVGNLIDALDIEKIVVKTGLSVKEIEKLRRR